MNKEAHFRIWQKAFRKTFTLNSILAAAGTAYFAFFSFFPLVLLIVAIASRWFDPLWVESELITQLEFIVPGITRFLGDNLAKVVQNRGSITTTALLLLLWSGSTLFSIVARVMDSIWEGRDTRSTLRYRGLALLFVIGLSILVLPLLIMGTWLTPLINGLLPNLAPFLLSSVSFLFSTFVSIVLFGLLYRFLPHTSPAWHDIWIAAIAAGFLWEIAKRIFLSYTASFLTSSNLVYGSVSTIIVFLAWVHLSGLIFFFGAYLGVEYRGQGEKERRKMTRRKSD
ncbi:MAG: YihY/virulence factor BrkB family protein [Anaerolineae bacterium]|jgi:YihY family inner membrane protein|nr:YihY/virulence factor BrkB family protein [Anaerolineae bacterium]MBT7071512.1 YihY/virulence factor BrkB family protein [Anaerolineae bacterium]